MRLEPHGHPPPHRAPSPSSSRHAPTKARTCMALVLDLRKRGFVPVAGDLQGAGIITTCALAWQLIDPGARRSRRSPAEQRELAFEPSARHRRESLPRSDRPHRRGWRGRARDSWRGARRRSAARADCSHLLTARPPARSSAAVGATARSARSRRRPARPAGRVSSGATSLTRRAETARRCVQLTAQDLRPPLRPAGASCLMDRFAEPAPEVRLIATSSSRPSPSATPRGSERRRAPRTWERGGVADRREAIAWLSAPASAPRHRRAARPPGRRPRRPPPPRHAPHARPALVQCAAAHVGRVAARLPHRPSVIGGWAASPTPATLWRQRRPLDQSARRRRHRPPGRP